MLAIPPEPGLVARCGRYCGACRAFLDRRCRGCGENESSSWCKAGRCCEERGHASCADCTEFADVRACGSYNGLLPKLVGFILRADRAACIDRIRAVGYEAFAREMAARRMHTLRRG